jgi:hypothetical protein
MNTKQELMNTTSQIDGFAGYVDEYEGQDHQPSSNLIQGELLAFTNNREWLVKRSGETLPPDLELIVVGVVRAVNKWVDKERVDTIVLGPGEKWPDIDRMNAGTPKEEWSEGPNGQPQGPWQAQRLVYLLHLATMTKYTWASSTTGGKIAISDLIDKIKWMQKFRGANVAPTVLLSDTFMKTRFGGRQRPNLLIKGDKWINLDATAALPETKAPVLAGPTVAEVKPTVKPARRQQLRSVPLWINSQGARSNPSRRPKRCKTKFHGDPRGRPCGGAGNCDPAPPAPSIRSFPCRPVPCACSFTTLRRAQH